MGEVFRNIVEVLRGSGLGFRIFFLITFFFVLVIADLYTNFGFHLRMTQQINLLEKLEDLSEEPLARDPKLRAIHNNLVQKLESYSERGQPSFDPIISWFTTERTWKFLSASLLWVLVGIAAMLGAFGLTAANIGVGFVVFVTFSLFGYIATLIPTLYSLWVNCILYALIFQIVPLILLSRRGRTQPS